MSQERYPLLLNELLQRMLAVVRGHLHTFSDADPCALAQHKDLVWSSIAPHTLHQVLDDNPFFYSDFLSCNMVNQSTMIEKDYSSRYQRNSSKSSSSLLCFDQEKHGKKARKCNDPCSFQSQMGNSHTGGRRFFTLFLRAYKIQNHH